MKFDTSHISATMSLLLFLVVGTVGAGCTQLSNKQISGDVLDFQALASEVWGVGKGVKLTGFETPRVAMAEFTVEFVLEKGTDVSSSMELELPGILYRGFAETLSLFDRQLVPLPRVSNSAAYARLKGTRMIEAELVTVTSPDPDSSRSVRFPVHGLLVLDEGQSDADQVILDVIDEVEADAAIQVRLRVGIRDGRATIERGSSLRLISKAGSGLLTMRKTIVSDLAVLDEGAVSSRLFTTSVQRLFRPAIAMALMAMNR